MVKYYSLKKILKNNSQYNVIIGERSNGKTYACLKYALDNFFKKGEEFVYLRRWNDDVKTKRMQTLFTPFKDYLEKRNGKVIFKSGTFYFVDLDTEIETVMAYALSISEVEHMKSSSYENVTTVIFDEFLTRRVYLVNEFVSFMNVLSTIIRKRENVIIFMLGNTVNRFCPYFSEMGLKNIEHMKQGTIDLYKYSSGMTVSVEYCSNLNRVKKGSSYFAFDNPDLKMITEGKWELGIYPHISWHLYSENIFFSFVISFNDKLYQGDIYNDDNGIYIFIHNKTTPIKEDTWVFSLESVPSKLYNKSVYIGGNKVLNLIKNLFLNNKVFYQDNSVGDSINNYLKGVKYG